MKSRKGAMEMSVGTIVTIVLLMSVLVLGIFLVQKIFTTGSESIDIIDDQVKGEIMDLFGSSGKNIVIALGTKNTAKIKQGTENFGIPIAFSPTDPAAWTSGCTYSITINNQPRYCLNQGWSVSEITRDIKTGVTRVEFDEIDKLNGYALIKIDIPETVAPCLQRFGVNVECSGGHSDENIRGSFDIEIIKKGLF